jgi:hypothetical protein
MTIKEAYNFLESLKIETAKKSEIKVYEKFLYILNELKRREFTKDEIQSIEEKLDRLQLESNPKNRNKHYNKALNKFENYLKEKFSLTTKGYYTKYGVGFGSSFGILFGILFLSSLERSLDIALGLSIGMIIGLIIGRTMDSKAETAGTIL